MTRGELLVTDSSSGLPERTPGSLSAPVAVSAIPGRVSTPATGEP